jgi:hypothetical protein
MALRLKTFNSIGGFGVGENQITVADANGNIYTNNITTQNVGDNLTSVVSSTGKSTLQWVDVIGNASSYSTIYANASGINLSTTGGSFNFGQGGVANFSGNARINGDLLVDNILSTSNGANTLAIASNSIVYINATNPGDGSYTNIISGGTSIFLGVNNPDAGLYQWQFNDQGLISISGPDPSAGAITIGGAFTGDSITVANTANVGTDLGVTGNIYTGAILTDNYFWSNGQPFIVDAYSNANVASFLANFGSNVISTTGNITGGGLTSTGDISTATGTISGATVNAGTITATGNVNGLGITAGLSGISSTGTISGPAVNTDALTVTNGITAGSLSASGAVIGATVTANGNVTAAGVTSNGDISAVGTISGANFAGGSLSLTGQANIGTNLGVTGSVDVGSDLTVGTTATITGNASAANFATGIITTTGDVGVGGALTVASSATITGSVTTSSNVSVGTDLAVGGTANVTGNVNVTGAGAFGSDVSVAGNAAVTGNLSAANTTVSSLYVSTDAQVIGNLTITGNLTYTEINNIFSQDPTFTLGTGANGAPLTSDDGLDRAVVFDYFNTGANLNQYSALTWAHSSNAFQLGANVTFANGISTVQSYADLTLDTLYGNVSATTIAATGNASIGGTLTVQDELVANSLSIAGTFNAGTITGNNISTPGNASIGLNVSYNGTLTGPTATFTNGVTTPTWIQTTPGPVVTNIFHGTATTVSTSNVANVVLYTGSINNNYDFTVKAQDQISGGVYIIDMRSDTNGDWSAFNTLGTSLGSFDINYDSGNGIVFVNALPYSSNTTTWVTQYKAF